MLMHHHAHVGRALNVGLAAQRVQAATRHADVAQEKLQHRHRAGVLRTVGVLRLAERVEQSARLTDRTGLGVGLVHKLEGLLVHAADVAHGVKVVA